MGFALSADAENVTWVLEDSRETLQVPRSINHALYENIKFRSSTCVSIENS